MARILPKGKHTLSTDGFSETQLDWYDVSSKATSTPTFRLCDTGRKRQKFPSDILYQPSTKTNDSQWGAQPIYQLTHERPSFEARARLLEGLLVILKYSTQDSINLFLLTIRNPQLQVTDLLQALNELFERCRCDEIAETISTCQCMMSSLSFEDMLSLSNCLTMGRSPENSERSSPRHRSVSAGVSLLPSESSPISAYSALSTNQVTITSQQLSIANESMKPTNGNYAVIQQTTMVYPINDCQTQSILPPQKKLESQVWHDKLLPQPFKTTAVLGSSQLDRLDKRVYDVPLLDPQNDFSTYCLDLRNSGRRALARGISLNRLSYWGKMDCELLFRDRVAQDDWNIPNWACEVSRRLPPMTPATRMGFAVIFTKMMQYLISPSIDTWQQLPTMLRPTDSQMRTSHDISVNFAPSPKLRDCLVEKPTDWLLVWLKNHCGMNWAGKWGDVGTVELTEVGNWKPCLPMEATHADNSSGIEALRAIECDSNTGRRHISHEFQMWCWDHRSWYISREVLKVWPDLFGEIPII